MNSGGCNQGRQRTQEVGLLQIQKWCVRACEHVCLCVCLCVCVCTHGISSFVSSSGVAMSLSLTFAH